MIVAAGQQRQTRESEREERSSGVTQEVLHGVSGCDVWHLHTYSQPGKDLAMGK